MCPLILWSSALGLLFGKFRKFLTELSAQDMTMVGNCFTFFVVVFFCGEIKMSVT